MAVQAVEKAESANISTSEGKLSATRSWIVYDDGGAAVTVSAALTAVAVTKAVSQHPDYSNMYARDYAVVSLGEKGERGYEVSWTYSPLNITDQTTEPGEVGYLEWSADIQVQYRDVWRTGVTLPADGDPTTSDIEGDGVDEGGEPISKPVHVIQAKFSKIFDGRPDISTYTALTGKRNNAAWLGAATGTLVFAGATVERTDLSLYRVSFTVHWDRNFHLHQIAKKDTDGEIKIAESGTYEGKAEEVYFRQPFDEDGNFDDTGLTSGDYL